MNSLTYNYDTWSAVMFPAPDTCEFSTKQCRKHCPEKANAWMHEAYKKIMHNAPLLSANKILNELRERNQDQLAWFESGDCLNDDLHNIVSIMTCLSDRGIVQHGFTRNYDLWTLVRRIPHTRFAYTTEHPHMINASGLIAVPDYDNTLVRLYWDEESVYTCGGAGSGGWCASAFAGEDEQIFEANCHACRKNARGCFVEWVT